MKLPREEITRKLLHLFALVMPAGIYCIPMFGLPWYVPTIILAAVLAGSVIIEHWRMKNPVVQKVFYKAVGSMLRSDEKHRVTGSTWVIGAAFICSIVFREESWISLVVLTLFILGDAVAALVGMSIGRIRIGKKSLEGSVACFILCMLLLTALFPLVPGALDRFGGKLPLVVSTVVAFTITFFELVPLRVTRNLTVNDNLAVPVIAGFALQLLAGIFA